jgi:hypothetical protein
MNGRQTRLAKQRELDGLTVSKRKKELKEEDFSNAGDGTASRAMERKC